MRWQSRMRLAKNFIDHMIESGVRLTVVECAYGDRPHELSGDHRFTHIPVRAATLAWSKESLLNIGIRALPDDAKYVCWADADILHHRKDWAAETVHALQLQPVVQPWSEALDLGPKGEVMTVKGKQIQTSFGWVWREIGDVVNWWKSQQEGFAYNYPHAGYSWSATMQWLNDVGLLLPVSGLGAADHQMSLAMVGEVDRAIHGLSSPAYKAAVKAWGDRAFRITQGHVGYVPGMISHHWHGEKTKRKYVERWDVLNRHQFDPHADLHMNRYGVLELSGNKPAMRRDFEAYFRQRDEDASTRSE